MLHKVFIVILTLISIIPVIGQNIVINEFCSLNSLYLDEDKDSPDWIEIYNAGSNVANLDGWSLTDDINSPKKWVFPQVNLYPQQPLLVFASGKDRKEIIYYNTLINQGDEYSYSIGSASIPTNWNTLGFDDSGWNKGPSGFGYGDNDDATITPNGTISVYVRKTFSIDNLSDISDLLLHIDYDDGFVAYINGTEVARKNMGEANTTIFYDQTASPSTEPLIIYGNSPELFPINNVSNLLIQGRNVLCIQVHNFSSTSSDLTLIPFLTVGYKNPVSSGTVPEILGVSNKKMHTNFKIGADGEHIFLVSPQNIVIDKTDSVALPPNVSMGRKPDGNGSWLFFDQPTPAAFNSTKGYDSISEQQIVFSPKGGVYTSSVEVTLKSQPGLPIYYTIDGSEPTEQSLVYTKPISINKSTSLRAKVFSSDLLCLKPSIQTYVIENREIKLPVVSLTTDPYNLFDWNYGIYADGPDWTADNPHFGANYWMDWERPIFFEYFNEEGTKVFQSSCGVKIFGAWSRANAQKSMALYARNSYGSKTFDYPFFKERQNKKYHALVLRNSGNDWSNAVMRDALHTGLLTEVDIDRQAYQPVVVYINGEYWGILDLREKVDNDFIADNNPGVDADKLDILQNNGDGADVLQGTSNHYKELLSFISVIDMKRPEVYEEVKSRMEVINYMDYEIAQIYVDNEDWPGNNIKFWRPQTETGKWRWIIYDTDFGFGLYSVLGPNGYDNNTLAFALQTNGPSWPNPDWSTFLLRSLMENPDFKMEFINRFADRINYDFESSRVNYLIDSLQRILTDEMPYHIARWNHIWDWDYNVERLITFATLRPNYMRTFINSQFSLGGIVSLTLDVSDKSQGYIQVSSLYLKSYPWKGYYFRKNPVRVTALAKPGFEFSHWEGIDSTKASVLLSIPASGLRLKAVFKVSEKEYNNVVINEINYKSWPEHDCGNWVELFNTSDITMDVSNWVLKDSDNANSFKIPNGTLIAPKNMLVIYGNEVKFKSVYPQVKNSIGAFSFNLANTEDMVRLYDAQNNLIDSVLYLGEKPWPSISDSKAETLSLISPYKNNEPYYRWEASSVNGTPGAQNDNFVEINEAETAITLSVTCYPNPFTQQTTMHWQCNEPDYITIELFDFKGTKLGTLFDGNCPAGRFETVWTPNSQIASGLYFARIKAGNGEWVISKLFKY